MNPRRLLTTVVALAALALAPRAVVAQDSPKDDKPAGGKSPVDAAKDAVEGAAKDAVDATKSAAKDAMAKMSPEDQKMMEMMMKVAAPGDHHRHLAQLEGRWNAVTKMRWGPDKPWEESKGVMENRMVLGGRFLHMAYKGESGGQPFEGAGTVGYDNVMKKYVSTWMDTMGTGCMITYGECDPAHKIITAHGEMADPMQDGKMAKFRTVTTIIDKDKHSYQMFCASPDGKGDFMCLDVLYTRTR